jgi:hypothetical protein
VASIALYYPWMHFQSDDWVKLALLTWDGVARVRPPDLPPRDSAVVREVTAETDLIIDLVPGWHDLEVVDDTFTEVMTGHRKEISKRFRHDGQQPPSDGFAMAASNTGGTYAPTDPRSFWVYCGDSDAGSKIARGLASTLVDHELAVRSPDDRAWLGMRPELASIYLAVLADAMGRHNSLSPTTDDPRVHRAPGALEKLTALLLGTSAPAAALADAKDAYLHLALRAVIEPERLAAVPVSKIIKFRQRHAAELAAFRTHVAGLSDELRQVAEVENLEIAHKHLEVLYQQQTKPQLDELRRALRGHGVESTAGSLALRVDLNAATGTVLGGVAVLGGQLALAGAAVAVTVVPYLAGRFRARREQVTGSPVAYLLAADRELAGSRLLRAMR